ncbi:hypothetical protein EDD32_0667 [Georgenia muralis]|uniref:Uncharacterized protein n=2 Tax=Georgenia muralis TaxID=154117 RepID=A0A3N4Z318_9MICO|nr:hypothetical protein EDD32_0667 [Georgenia muralis]
MVHSAGADPAAQALEGMWPFVSSMVALAPLLTPVVAVVAAWVALRTLGHRRTSDDRAHWWARTQWAIERVELARREDLRRIRAVERLDADRPWWRRRSTAEIADTEPGMDGTLALGILQAQVVSPLARRDDKEVVARVSEWLLGPDELGDEPSAGREPERSVTTQSPSPESPATTGRRVSTAAGTMDDGIGEWDTRTTTTMTAEEGVRR